MFDDATTEEPCPPGVRFDAAAVSDGELLAAAVALEAQRTAMDALEVAVLAELDRRGVCDREHGLTTGAWLARETRLPPGVARQRVKVATTLTVGLPEVAAALAAGQIGWDHARVLAGAAIPRLADTVAGLQRELLDLAAGTGFGWWHTQVRGLIDLIDTDGGHDPADDETRNSLTLAATFQGLTHVSGKLAGDTGETVRHSIDTVADELFRRCTRDHDHTPDLPVPRRATLRALALAEICRRALATDPATTVAPRPEIVLVIPASDPTAATTPHAVAVQDGTYRTLLCDPDLYPVVIDSLGVPLDLGRTTRYATPAQRRALATRDGGCIFPGCEHTIGWCDIHHVQPWHHHGPTDLPLLAPLCRRHHGVAHRRGWTLTATPDGWYLITTPTGTTLWSQRHGRPRTGPTPTRPPPDSAPPDHPPNDPSG